MLRRTCLGVALYLAAVTLSFTQSGTRENGFGAPDRRARQERFDATTPAIGDPMPDLTAYDADGEEFKLSSLKGSYSVLVLGCLT